MADPFAGVLLKLDRADHHLRVLDRVLRSFLSRKPYGIVANVESTDREPRPHPLYRVTVAEQPPTAVGCLVGDTIHNLRCALDHIAWQLPRSPRPRDEDIQFPIWTDKFHSGSPKLVGLTPGAVDAIEGLQPFPRSDGRRVPQHLAPILHLSNFDKHREIVVGGAGVGGLSWYSADDPSSRPTYNFFAPFVRDTVVMEFAPGAEVSMDPYLRPYVAVAKPDEWLGAELPGDLQLVAKFVRETVVPDMRKHVPGAI